VDGGWRTLCFAAPFEPQDDEYIVRGRSCASVLKNSTLNVYLRNNRLDTVIFMGFSTHVCVESNLREGTTWGSTPG
jgi:nicotinamidase-related amidase